MPIINYPEFEEYKTQAIGAPFLVGVFVGGCVARGDGSSFRACAHAHVHKGDKNLGWICVRSQRRLYTRPGQPSMLMIHELAHILTGQGHTDTWRDKVRELGGRITRRYKKRPSVGPARPHDSDHSLRKRTTAWLSSQVGFAYDWKQYPYGGHFHVSQLLQIQVHITGLKEKAAELQAELAKKGEQPCDGNT